MAGEELKRLWEQFLQLELIDSHEEAGNLTAKTARGYRLHVLRVGSIYGFPQTGPTRRSLCSGGTRQGGLSSETSGLAGRLS